MRHPLLLIAVLVFAMSACRVARAESVRLEEDDRSYTMSNGSVTARVDKQNGNLIALKYRGLDLLQGGRGYWSCVGSRPGAVEGTRTATIRQDPAQNGGAIAEVSIRFVRDSRPNGFPADVDYRYALTRDGSGLYAYSIWEHRAGYPPLDLAEARYALKLNSQIFDYLTVDEQRRGQLPSGADWDRGVQLDLKEVRRIVTGPFAGRVEHKYDYSALLADTPAYGWSSTTKGVGVWMVNPSFEYISGGATKVDLTGHLDVNPGGAPTLLNMWVGSHYGGSAFSISQDEIWTKFVGPFFLYCNAGADQTALWKDALATSRAEASAWPYSWLDHPAYPGKKQRGEVVGKIVLSPDPSARWANLQVGLTAPDYPGRERSGFKTVDWQREAKFYQFWTKADPDGAFVIPNIRPGKYVLRAIADGIPGELVKTDVTISPGQRLEIGSLGWTPQTFGKTLWQIGTVDRTAREFRNGDHYWQWGLPQKFAEQFPNGVNFVIGKSDPHQDWNYCQVPVLNGRRAESSSWAITFDSPGNQKGVLTLRLGIAGSRAPQGIEVSLNDQIVGQTGPLPDTGTMHRDGIRGYWCERRISIDAALLKPGQNQFRLRVPASSWVNGVLYDYVRLEFQDDSAAAAGSQKTDSPQT